MERNFYTDRFEQLLREKSDEFRMVPSKRVWHSIYNDLRPGRKWPSPTMGMILILVLLMIGYLNSSDNTLSKMIANTATPDMPTSLASTNGGFVPGIWPNSSPSTGASVSPNEGLAFKVFDITQPGNLATNIPGKEKQNDLTASGKIQDFNYDHRIIESVDYYIHSNQLFADLALKAKHLQNNADIQSNETGFNEPVDAHSDELKRIPSTSTANKILYAVLNTAGENKNLNLSGNAVLKTKTVISKKAISQEDKAWMEDFALHNKSGRQKWKDKMSMEIYATPGVGYRTMTSNIQNEALANSLSPTSGSGIDQSVQHKPGIGMETGVGLSYSLSRFIQLKAGIQLNYTSYGISADQTNHPILTNLLLNGPNTGNLFLAANTSTFSNSSGLQPVTLHNTTYQFSLPVGMAIKLAGNNNLSWFAGATLQPSFVIGGTANLISSDYKNYITDATLLRKWNMNTGFETYVNYKLGSYTLKVGPQLRYQLLSTYDSKYTFSEKLYNMGIKVGVVKGF